MKYITKMSKIDSNTIIVGSDKIELHDLRLKKSLFKTFGDNASFDTIKSIKVHNNIIGF